MWCMVLLFLVMPSIVQAQTPRNFILQNGVLITNITVISASEQKVRTFVGYVILEGDTILYAGKKRPLVKGNFQTIEGKGKYLVPGLIDSHVHVNTPVGLTDDDFENNPELVNSYYRQLPKTYLYYGFTSLIDLNLTSGSRKRFESAEIKPRLFGVGGIRILDGYGPNFFPKPLRYKAFPDWVYNPEQLADVPENTDLTQHTPKFLANKLKQTGMIGIKTYFERGTWSKSELPVPNDELLKQIVDQSHMLGLPVAIHAPSAEGYQKGLNAGVDIFAHGLWYWNTASPLDTDPTPEVKSTLKQLGDSGKYVQATMRVISGEIDTYTWSLVSHPELKNALPGALIEHLKSEQGKASQRFLIETYTKNRKDPTIDLETYLHTVQKRFFKAMKLAIQFKVNFIFGSDTPAEEGVGNVPGFNGQLELKELHAAGLSLEQIFLAATSRNAKAFGLEKKLGTIEPGKLADLLILKGNPLKTITAYGDIETVVVSGKVIPRRNLSAVDFK